MAFTVVYESTALTIEVDYESPSGTGTEADPYVYPERRTYHRVAIDQPNITYVFDDPKRANVANAVATLRQWANDAEATTATSGNAVAVLNTVVDRLGVFFGRFADLIEAQRLDQS